MDRIAALPRHYPGLAELRGAVLADDLDPELQALSQEASRAIGTPMAAMSLMLEHIQLFRGYHGLAPEFAAARAGDRDSSFCQFVVRDNSVVEVNDAPNDPRMPQALVKRYSIVSYLGAPVVLDGQAVGAMCVLDTKPRRFDDAEREAIVRMAALASKRLEVLAATPRDLERALLQRAVRPAFSELRNRLTPVLGNISLMQVALSELAAAQRLATYVAATGDLSKLELLTHATASIEELKASLEDLTTDSQAIARSIIALERASTAASAACSLEDVIDAALTLAHHRTKLVGGVRRPAPTRATLQAPRPIAVTALSAALTQIADSLCHARRASGMGAIVTQGDREVRVQITAEVEPYVFAALGDHMRLLLADTTVEIEASAAALDIVYPRPPVPEGARADGATSADAQTA